MSTRTRTEPATKVAAAVCAVAGLWLIVSNTVADWQGPARVAAYVIGGLLLVTALGWLVNAGARALPAVTMFLGILLVVAPFVLFYRDEPTGPGVSQFLTGLVVASTGFWAGRRLDAARLDRL